MKYLQTATIIFFLLPCLSCNDVDKEGRITNLEREVEALKVKVNQLEARNDSFLNISLYQNRTTKKTSNSKPVMKQSSESKSFSTSNSTHYSGQCMAITKKGTRCKRAARSNGYCWQHGG